MIKKIFFKNSKGNKLAGVLSIPDKEGKFPAVIRLHGFISNKEGTSRVIQERLKDEFVSLIFDYHAHGESEGKFEDFTISGALDDCQTALNHLLSLEQVDSSKIAVTGTSLGGMLALLLAARNPSIKVLSIGCPVIETKEVFGAVHDVDLWEEQGWIDALGNEGLKIKYKFFEDGVKYDMFKEAEKIKCPVYIILGDRDEYIPVEHLRKLMPHLKNGKLEIVPGADHNFTQHYEYYLTQTIRFIKENL